MYYLNSPNGAYMFAEAVNYTNFVDKSALIADVYRYSQKESKYIAITRPRRFGKTMAANMLSAFFTRGQDAEKIFAGLRISKDADIWEKRNSFDVIHIDFLEELDGTDTYEALIGRLKRRLVRDLCDAFPQLEVTEDDNLPTLFARTGRKFIFIIDEWDALFEMRFMTRENKEDYIVFLRNLLKNRGYVSLTFLTGILPIAKYSPGSPLNMFHEFHFFARIGFEEYYGFSEEEIRLLMKKRGIGTPSLEEIRLWYDGYVRRSDGEHIFNPDSVCKALTDGRCQNNWAGTGPMNDIANLIAENAFEVRDDILRMTAGEVLSIRLDGFGAEDGTPRRKKDLLSAMVIYGFLSYDNGRLSIPNLELSQKFVSVLERGTLGVHMTLEESRRLLLATLSGKEKETAAFIERTHDEQIPFIQYADENSLACVIMYAYYGALDYYEIKREEKAGKGFVDFLFTPVDKRYIPIIMELKYNHSAAGAIKQIRDRNYLLRMKNYPEVLLVGINFSEKTKKHTCRIERVKQ